MPFVGDLTTYQQIAVSAIFAFLVGLTVGLSVAEYNAIKRRRLSQGSLGIDAMYRLWKDENFRKNITRVMNIPHEIIARYAVSPEELGSHAEREQRDVILNIINYFETLAVGANMGIYSRKVFSRLIKAQTIGLYQQVSPFLEALRQRQGYEKSGKEFEKLVRKWGGIKNLKKRLTR